MPMTNKAESSKLLRMTTYPHLVQLRLDIVQILVKVPDLLPLLLHQGLQLVQQVNLDVFLLREGAAREKDYIESTLKFIQLLYKQ